MKGIPTSCPAPLYTKWLYSYSKLTLEASQLPFHSTEPNPNKHRPLQKSTIPTHLSFQRGMVACSVI